MQAKKLEVVELCEQYGVARLWAFGSAVTGSFNSEKSDYDFLVDWKPSRKRGAWGDYEFRMKLRYILGRDIDLIEDKVIKNPYFAYETRSVAVPIYG